MVRAYQLIAVGLLSVTLLLTGCSGDDGKNGAPGTPGAPGEQGPPGVSTGTVSGTVTNSLTGTGVANVTVTTAPAVSGVSIKTDANGNYNSGQALPTGIYTLTFAATNFTSVTNTVSVTAGQSVTDNVALVPVQNVVKSTTVTGTVGPGQEVTVAASIKTYDGSTPPDITNATWAQKSGAAGVTITGTGSSVQVTLPGLSAFKDQLFNVVLANKGSTDEEVPPHSVVLNRNMVMPLTPLDLEETALVTLTATTASGPVDFSFSALPPPNTGSCTGGSCVPSFVWSTGLGNEPIGLPVLLHGKTNTSGTPYSWSLTSKPATSTAVLNDATTQNPYFTPDKAGAYVVSDAATNAQCTAAGVPFGCCTGNGAGTCPNTIQVDAGTWVGVIGPDGNPSSDCTFCHKPGGFAPDKFTPWKTSGHSQIFSNNLNSGGHYSSSCFPCHTVGYDLTENPANGGFDDIAGYSAFLAEFFPASNHGSPIANPNNWVNMLAKYPAVAKLANIQCENCHGPQASDAHMITTTDKTDNSLRISIAADVCGRCHGEPTRHGRFQEWQTSGHANYSVAMNEGTVEGRPVGSGNTDYTPSSAGPGHCGRCHSGQGFLRWITQATAGSSRGEGLDHYIWGGTPGTVATKAEFISYGMTQDKVHPQTCAVCHDPHAPGNSTGSVVTPTVRISGDTSFLPAGYTATNVGKGALCITCHNTRNGLHNDLPSNDNSQCTAAGVPFVCCTGNGTGTCTNNPLVSPSAPHEAAQGDVLMGENAYFVVTGQRARGHSTLPDTCVTCHMEKTDPPYEFGLVGQTNHNFAASIGICTQCHTDLDGTALQAGVKDQLADLASWMAIHLQDDLTSSSAPTTLWFVARVTNASGGTSSSARTSVDLSTNPITSVVYNAAKNAFDVTFTTAVTFDSSTPGTAPFPVTLKTVTVQASGIYTANSSTAYFIGGSDALAKAWWNYNLIVNDSSWGVHNPAFVTNVITATVDALQTQP